MLFAAGSFAIAAAISNFKCLNIFFVFYYEKSPFIIVGAFFADDSVCNPGAEIPQRFGIEEVCGERDPAIATLPLVFDIACLSPGCPDLVGFVLPA